MRHTPMVLQPRACENEVTEELKKLNVEQHDMELREMIKQQQVSTANAFLLALGFRAIGNSTFMIKGFRMDSASFSDGLESLGVGGRD